MSGNFIISAGSQVVVLKDIFSSNNLLLHPYGSVANVLRSPVDLEHAYRIRFQDGLEMSINPSEIVLLSKFKNQETGQETSRVRETLRNHPLFQFQIYRCVTGSRAYGLDDQKSDIDYRGVYLPPAELQWSLTGVPEQLECHETQEVYWELGKFLQLALKANPNILECLYTQEIVVSTPLMSELIAMREIFVTKLVYQTFSGYVLSQFKKMQSDIRNQGAVKWKHVMHLLRLLISGTHLLKHGSMQVRVGEEKEMLLAVKRGEVSWDDAEQLRLEYQQRFEQAFTEASLPDRPDYNRVNSFLVKARRTMV